MATYRIMIKSTRGNDWTLTEGGFGSDAAAVTSAEATVMDGYEWMTIVALTDGEGTRQAPAKRTPSPCYCDSAYHPAGH